METHTTGIRVINWFILCCVIVFTYVNITDAMASYGDKSTFLYIKAFTSLVLGSLSFLIIDLLCKVSDKYLNSRTK